MSLKPCQFLLFLSIQAQEDLKEHLGYVCNPRSLKEGTETSRRMTDEIGISPERPIYFECNGHWHAVIRIQLPLITAQV